MIKMCCVCKRIQSADRWIRATLSGRDKVTHGYCPDCFEGVMEEIEAYMSVYHSEKKAEGSTQTATYGYC